MSLRKAVLKSSIMSKSALDLKVSSSDTSLVGRDKIICHDAKLDFFGTKLATARSDNIVRIFQVDPRTEGYHKLADLTGYTGPVSQLSWSHPMFGNLLASASDDGRIIIWKQDENPSDRKLRWKAVFDEDVHSSFVNAVAFSPWKFGAMLAAGSSDGSISILKASAPNCWNDWNVTSRIVDSHYLGCRTVSWSPNTEGLLASGGNDYNVKLWILNGEDGWVLAHTLQGHDDWVLHVEWSPSEELLVSAGRDGKVLLWNQVEEPEAPKWNHSSSFINVSQCSDASEKWSSRVIQFYNKDKGSFTVNWDPMGHFLCVTGKNYNEDEEIYFWKHCTGDTWKCVSRVVKKAETLNAAAKRRRSVSFF